ncbi:hypothetical protein KAR91_80935 [Candidatus Pacearchaeota archaeon]|nr:hypothetical protein [Candidatus Pacearchaeota archaeon]
MKKLITNLAAKPIVKGVLKAADSAVLGGLVHNIREANEGSPKGQIDVAKAVGSLIPIILLIMLGMGIISMDDLKELIGIL